MKTKFLALLKILLSTIGLILLFVSIVGAGNYFQSHGLKYVGNTFMLLFPVSIYAYVYFLNKKLIGLKPSEYGFTLHKLFPNFLIGFLSSAVIMLTVFALSLIILDIDIQFIGIKENFLSSLLSMLTMLIIVGVWEEFYFRGFVFNFLIASKFGFHLSAFLSAILFSVIHWSSFDMNETSWLWYIGIVFIGYIFVIIYALTKSIWSVVSFHFFWNLGSFLMDDKENEIGIFSVINYNAHSKNIDNITVCVLGIVLILLLVMNYKKLKELYLTQ